MTRLLFACLASVLLAGCGASEGEEDTSPAVTLPATVPLPECPDANYETCDVREADCQTRIGELAACLRQNEPVTDLSIELMSPEAFSELLQQEASTEPEPPVKHFNRALSVFGLVPQPTGVTGPAQPPNIDDLLGVYRAKDKRIIIIDRGKPADTAYVDATLLHELIHALQDADHDLASWPDTDEVVTFDSNLAQNSVFEGEARFYEYRAAMPLLGLDLEKADFPSALSEHLEYTRGVVEKSDTPLRQSFSTFPYGFGAELSFAAWTEGGPRGTDPLWASPPRTTQQIMSQVLGLDTPQSSGVEIPPPVVATLESYDDDVLGAWGLQLLLSRQGNSRRDSDEQAVTWRGDHFWVYSSNVTSSTYFLWQIELASERDASRFDDLFSTVGGCQHGSAGTRVFASCVVDGITSPELTAWGKSWLAETAP